MTSKGYFKDYYVKGKYIGSLSCDKDREVFGFYGRKKEIVNSEIILSNGKKIKVNTEIITELQIICGKK